MSESRMTSFAEFWPYYLGEHRNRTCRALHFLGTSVFLGVSVACLVDRPLRFGVALLVGIAVGFVGSKVEPRRVARLESLLIATAWILGHGWVAAGIVFAYLCAWIGHFVVEKNRPATFSYPVWSLAADLKLWARMLVGRHWAAQAVTEAP